MKAKSLTQLKNKLEKEGKEKIISFNGWELITQRGKKKIKYGVYNGEVIETLVVEHEL